MKTRPKVSHTVKFHDLKADSSSLRLKKPKVLDLSWVKDLLLRKMQDVSQSLFNREEKGKKQGSRNFLWITFFVMKFLKILRERTSKRKVKRLATRHFVLMNDVTNFASLRFRSRASISNENVGFLAKKSVLRRIKAILITTFLSVIWRVISCLESLLGKIPIHEPDRPLIFMFDTVMLAYTLCLIANTLLKFSFSLNESHYSFPIWLAFEKVPGWLFLFETFLNLNTAYYSKGMYVSNRGRILKHYLKNNLIIDLLTILPQLLAFNDYSQIFVVLRVQNINGVIKRLEEYLQLKGKKEGVFQLVKLMVNMLFLAHISACTWHLMGIWEDENGIESNWLRNSGIENELWYIRYIYSLYFSIVTMITVGYGDIRPYNAIECLFNIFMIIYGSGVWAYSINNIGSIFKEMFQDDRDFKKKIKILSDYMNKRKLSKFLQIKIKKYLEYMYEEGKMNYKDSLLLTQTLSQSLKEECLSELYGRLLRKNAIFSNFSESLIKKLTHCFQEVTFAPDDLIKIQEEHDGMLYFILKGEITLSYTEGVHLKGGVLNGERKFMRIKTGETFGEICFITGDLKQQNAKSMEVTHAAYLKRGDFMRLIHSSPDDYEKFCKIRDSLLVSRNYSIIKIRCFSCHATDHLVSQCPLIHYIPNKLNIIKRHTGSEPQMRSSQVRKRKKVKALKDLTRIQARTSDFLKNSSFEDFKTLNDSERSGEFEQESENLRNFKALRKMYSMELKDKGDVSIIEESKIAIEDKTPINSNRKPIFKRMKTLKNSRNERSEDQSIRMIEPIMLASEVSENPQFHKVNTHNTSMNSPSGHKRPSMHFQPPNFEDIPRGNLIETYEELVDPVIGSRPGAIKQSMGWDLNFREGIENFERMRNWKFYGCENNAEVVVRGMRERSRRRNKSIVANSPNRKGRKLRTVLRKG